MKLFVFEHCPFCIRAMMVAGYKNLPIDVEFLQNQDVEARISKVGANMVPILQKLDGGYMAESLDVVDYLDLSDGNIKLKPGNHQEAINDWLLRVTNTNNLLVMPRWLKIKLPEFPHQAAKDYFENKKSKMLGVSFDEALAQSETRIEAMQSYLAQLDFVEPPSKRADQLNYDDILLFPILRNLTVVKGLEFPAHLTNYTEQVAKLCKIKLFHSVAV
ncbi:glutaredoxin 2 [Gayadomonas joobiniege]|uniref:glutaredoxin 2 n=1 Tax=Gayadomonas joobiniege TaxID=1234606 RepID=UPI0003747A9E|nr:glutaredoxin 2 [Gayadomonas joobiniege]